MSLDYKSMGAHISLTPIVFLRWVSAVAQLLVITASAGGIGTPLPATPLLVLVAASFVMNIHAITVYRRKRLPESAVRMQLVFDILQFSAFLMFTGGTENPFCILLLAPLAMAASLLSLFSLCLLIILVFLNIIVMAFIAHPLAWAEPMPALSPQYVHGVWISLLVTLVVVSFIIWRLAMEGRRVNAALSKTHAILEEKRRMTALGALAAAAVHELGSPLGTIALVTRELERDTHPDDPISDDIAILKTQADKCKKILADIARNPTKVFEGETLRLDRMLMEIASASVPADKQDFVQVHSDIPENLPILPKHANLEYGFGNLIGNAASYARTRISIDIEGNAEVIEITIEDDGPGFPVDILNTIGQPYISSRAATGGNMGLGIFISINLLEATDAQVHFSNGKNGGAFIRVIWPRSALEALRLEG